MVSKNQKKLIKSLYQKKYRKQHGLFVAEGKKVIRELLDADLQLYALFTTDVSFFDISDERIFEITFSELKGISFLTTPQTALAVFYIPDEKLSSADTGLTLMLDDVRDPGNLGTIIRLCDWFGIQHLVCSNNTVDCYNPKVVQATMGSITRVATTYTNLLDFLEGRSKEIPVFGTFMDGDSIYNEKLPAQAIIIMGNEAKGISDTLTPFISKKLTIPQFGSDHSTESLNVATATAIVLSEYCREL